VEKALQPLPGVAEVNVDFPKRLVHCKVQSDEFDVENAIEVLADADFEAKVAESTN
jgi:copper chaperone CopZ